MAVFLDFDRPGAGRAFGPVGRDFLATVGERSYRPSWVWVAERDGDVVARAAFWGGPEDERPYALDWFDIAANLSDRVEVGAELLRTALAALTSTAGERPEYHLMLPPGWRDLPAVREPAEERLRAAEQAGMEPFVERLRMEWRSSGPPSRSRRGRLVMRPVGSDDEWQAALTRVAEGTLDAYTRRDVQRSGVTGAAQAQLEWMGWMPAPREWWHVAELSSGELVGVVMPTRNHQAAVLGYVGVVPEHRGQGFAGELVRWATAFLAAQGVERIVADTDTGNTPMADTFVRCGYEVAGQRVVLL
jgi:RimJ/RimL family protein N-acetyltransferase